MTKDERLRLLLDSRLPAALEERLQRLDRLSMAAAVSFEDLGRRASQALGQILLQGQDVERVLQRLAASIGSRILQEAVMQPVTGLFEAALTPLPAETSAFTLPPAAPEPSNITINVSAPGGDPAQLRRSLGRAAGELARVVERGRRFQ